MRVNPILDIPLCVQCQRGHPEKYGYITKTRARGEYRLKESDLAELVSYEVDNPHYKKAAPMQLYLHQQVRKLAREKYGKDEAYIVRLVPFSENQLKWFADDPDRIRAMSPREDLKRWLRNDFDNESEWREIPESIEVAPGVRIFIPRKSVIVPTR